MKRDKKIFSFLDVSIIVLITSLVMCFLGGALIYKHLGGVNFSLLDEDAHLQELIGAYNNLVDNYYYTLDKKELINGAINGMYSVTGDPYTTYLNEGSANSLENSLNGKYTGIGITIKKNDNDDMEIYQVHEGTPAHKAGLLKGDLIKKVNGEEVNGNTDITEKIKSAKSVELTIMRSGVEYTYKVSTANLNKPVVESMTFVQNGKRIGYIRLTIFNSTCDIQIGEHLSNLEKDGIDALILDLRDNTGGYLQMAENIAEMFLEKGKVIYSLESKNSIEIAKDETNERRTYPISVIINKHAASASEVLAGALKYSYGAKLVGNKSYGKGKVQEKSSLSSGTAIKYTTARWLVPNGECIDGVGLTPDIEVDLDYDQFDQTNIYTDSQVMRAVNDLAG